MPVDSGVVTETIERIFGKGLPETADPHGHIGADGRKHTAQQISEELHHREALCLMRTADAQELADLKLSQKPLHRIICLLRFHQLL